LGQKFLGEIDRQDQFPFQADFERDWKEKNLEELLADGRLKLSIKYQGIWLLGTKPLVIE